MFALPKRKLRKRYLNSQRVSFADLMMLAIDGAHAPTRPEPSPREGKRGKGKYKEAKTRVSEYILLIKIGLFI